MKWREVLNSLVIIFIISEYQIKKYSLFSNDIFYSLGLRLLFPCIIFNVISASVLANRIYSTFDMIGGDIINLFSLILLYYIWKVVVYHSLSHNLSNDFFIVILISTCMFSIKFLGFDHYAHHTEIFKVIFILLSYSLLLYFDVKRSNKYVSSYQYFMAIKDAIIYSFFAIPLIAVVISCMLLIFVNILEKLKFDPENSPFINSLIFYGTFYGPFYIIYWHAKKSLLKLHILPSN